MSNPKESAVEVIQSDRDAAADLSDFIHMGHTPKVVAHIREGGVDHSRMVQAFARHRLAAMPAASEGEDRPKVLHLGVALQGIADYHADVLTPRQIEACYQAAAKLWDAPATTDQDTLIVENLDGEFVASFATKLLADFFIEEGCGGYQYRARQIGGDA